MIEAIIIGYIIFNAVNFFIILCILFNVLVLKWKTKKMNDKIIEFMVDSNNGKLIKKTTREDWAGNKY